MRVRMNIGMNSPNMSHVMSFLKNINTIIEPAALDAKLIKMDRQRVALKGTVFTQRRSSSVSTMIITAVIIAVGIAVSGVKRFIRGEIASAWHVEG